MPRRQKRQNRMSLAFFGLIIATGTECAHSTASRNAARNVELSRGEAVRVEVQPRTVESQPRAENAKGQLDCQNETVELVLPSTASYQCKGSAVDNCGNPFVDATVRNCTHDFVAIEQASDRVSGESSGYDYNFAGATVPPRGESFAGMVRMVAADVF